MIYFVVIVMAESASRSYIASEVLHILEDNELYELYEEEIGDLLSNLESEDDNSPEGDGTGADGSPMLIPSEYLVPDGTTPSSNPRFSFTCRESLLLPDAELLHECLD